MPERTPARGGAAERLAPGGKSEPTVTLMARGGSAGNWLPGLGVTVVVLAVLGIFLPTLGFPFLHYDEQPQLVGNPLVRSLSPANVRQMFSHFSITNYYPVRLLSFAIDYAIWGLRPAGYRLTNILLHLASTLLVFGLVWRVSRQAGGAGGEPVTDRARGLAALAAAGLFALHPVVVEPVVWVSGREELLMVFFTLLGMHCHISAQGDSSWLAAGARRSRLERSAFARRAGLHFLAGVCVACACMSNVVAAAVAMIVTAHDLAIYRNVRRAIAGTWFLWLISMGAIVAKKMGDRIAHDLGVLTKQGLHLAPLERVRAVFDGYWLSIKSLVWPANLAAMYPKTVPESFLAPTVLAGMVLALLTLVLLWKVRADRTVLFGLLWFLLALAPSAQIVPHHIHHGDRFLYLPLVGVSLAVGIALMRLSARGLRSPVLAGPAVLILGVLGTRSALQAQLWRDGATLFQHSVDLYPDVADAHNNLGLSLTDRGDWRGAFEHLSAALRLQPGDADLYFNLGVVQIKLNDRQSAIENLTKAIELDPRQPDANYFLGKAYMDTCQMPQATAHLRKAVELAPRDADSRQDLGDALFSQGKTREAAEQYRAALALQLNRPVAANNLAYILATDADSQLRNGAEAVRLAEQAIANAGQENAQALDTLAAAYAEAGRFPDAVGTARKAMALATQAGNQQLLGELQARLALYEAGQPYHAEPSSRPASTSASGQR